MKRLLTGFALSALAEARKEGPYRLMVGGDIRALPFRDGSLSGLWNLGVMEHFPKEDGIAILREFRRVTRPGGTLVICEFSSPTWTPFRTVYTEYLMKALPGRCRPMISISIWLLLAVP